MDKNTEGKVLGSSFWYKFVRCHEASDIPDSFRMIVFIKSLLLGLPLALTPHNLELAPRFVRH